MSLLTKPKPDRELNGLVYGCTEIPSEGHLPLCQRPIFWAGVVAVVFVILKSSSGRQNMHRAQE